MNKRIEKTDECRVISLITIELYFLCGLNSGLKNRKYVRNASVGFLDPREPIVLSKTMNRIMIFHLFASSLHKVFC